MNAKLAREIQAAQDHGRSKYGRGPKDYAHDDEHSNGDWVNMIANHNANASTSTPMEAREYFKIAGLAVSAVESHDRKRKKRT